MQITIQFDNLYSIFYFLFLLFTTIYKGKSSFRFNDSGSGGLLYPPSIWEVEIATVVFFFGIQIYRLNIGYDANRTEHSVSMMLFLILTIFSTLFCIYFSFLTTYVLLIEIVVGVIAIFFGVLEIALALVAIIMFSKANHS